MSQLGSWGPSAFSPSTYQAAKLITVAEHRTLGKDEKLLFATSPEQWQHPGRNIWAQRDVWRLTEQERQEVGRRKCGNKRSRDSGLDSHYYSASLPAFVTYYLLKWKGNLKSEMSASSQPFLSIGSWHKAAPAQDKNPRWRECGGENSESLFRIIEMQV